MFPDFEPLFRLMFFLAGFALAAGAALGVMAVAAFFWPIGPWMLLTPIGAGLIGGFALMKVLV